MKVEDLLTKEVKVCFHSNTLDDAARLMSELDCGSLPVLDEHKQLVGMITDRDICLSAQRENKGLRELKVQDGMSRGALTCAPDDDHLTAEAIMSKARIRRLPVLESGRLVGILTLAQIARASGNGVTAEEVGHTLAAISQPARATTSS
jgi:CBS domain-containing protein